MIRTFTARISTAVRRRSRLATVFAFVTVAALLLLFAQGDKQAGSTNLDILLNDLEEQVRLNPQDVDTRISIASAYLARGLLAESIEQFEQALVLEPNNQSALIGLGRAYLDAGDLEAAEPPLRLVAELNADNEFRYSILRLGDVYYDLATISMHNGDFESAAAELSDALIIRRDDADTWRLLGQVWAQAGDYEAAEAAFLEAVRFVPDYSEVYADLENVYAQLGLPGKQAYARGMVYLTEGDVDAAIKELASAASASAPMPQALEGLGMAYEEAGRPAEALTAYRAALNLDPEMFLSALAVPRLESE